MARARVAYDTPAVTRMVGAPGVARAARQPRARRWRTVVSAGASGATPSNRWPAAAIEPAEARKLNELTVSRWIGAATAAMAAPSDEPAMTARRPVTSKSPFRALRRW